MLFVRSMTERVLDIALSEVLGLLVVPENPETLSEFNALGGDGLVLQGLPLR